MGKEYIIRTKNLTRKFKKDYVVKNVSMNVRKNTIYGLLGPNGAGKSTTLKILSGLLKKTTGEILFNDEIWTREDLNSIGSLIEEAPVYKNLTARENLKVHSTILALDDKRIDEVLEIVNLSEDKNKQVGKFSMGMKQRLGIAISILNYPKLLILDEPTNGLDPIGIQNLRNLIKSFKKQGITIILSSHILSEIQLIADDVGIIIDGILCYESENSNKINLEHLFMNLIENKSSKE